MKGKNFYLGLLIGGLLMVLFFYPQRISRAQKMTLNNFEYKIISMNYRVYSQTKEFQDIAKKNRDPRKAQIKFTNYVCSHLGSQGWELILVDRPPKSKTIFYLYFKRRKP